MSHTQTHMHTHDHAHDATHHESQPLTTHRRVMLMDLTKGLTLSPTKELTPLTVTLASTD